MHFERYHHQEYGIIRFIILESFHYVNSQRPYFQGVISDIFSLISYAHGPLDSLFANFAIDTIENRPPKDCGVPQKNREILHLQNLRLSQVAFEAPLLT